MIATLHLRIRRYIETSRRLVKTQISARTAAGTVRAVGMLGFLVLLVAVGVGGLSARPLLTELFSEGNVTALSGTPEGVELGHLMNWNPRIVADASGALLPQGTPLPCGNCHDAHDRPPGTISLLAGLADDETAVTGTRQLCTMCHRPSDSLAATPTVEGLLLHKLGAGVEDHASTSTRPCGDCHGPSHFPAPHGEGGDCAGCHGESGSHGVHVRAEDPRGPGGLACDACHDSGNYPYFAEGTDTNGNGSIELTETTVCDDCHSPGGDYNGLDSEGGSIGARDNWATGVYETTSTLQPGKARWCAGCHDKSPAQIAAVPSTITVSAPNVIGDETAGTPYGTGYGFYVTGHGLRGSPYPASQNPPGDIECDSCHDFAARHIDGESRTYSAPLDNYQAGYRLRDVNGGLPLEVPRTVRAAPPSDFALCLECHDGNNYLTTDPALTNFVSSGVNSHYTHTRSDGSWVSRWDSDWNGAGDSAGNCPACHNVHGSPSAAMIRHGELIGKVPALNFRYTPTSPDPYPLGPASTGGMLDLPGAGGTVASTGVCDMCHAQNGSYVRAWQDLLPPRIMRVYGRPGSDRLGLVLSEGVYTSTSGGALVPADFTYTDSDDARSIASIAHEEGVDHGVVYLSSALDSSDDVLVDTLAAATAASVYDASGLAMGTDAVVVQGDADAPALTNETPNPGATGVARNAVVAFTLSDTDSGVDWSSVAVDLSGSEGYTASFTSADSEVTKTGTRLEYRVTVDPADLYSLGETITVTVSAEDLVGNPLPSEPWTFQVSPTPTVETMIIHPSGLGSNPGGYWTVPGADQWADYLDTNDADTTYATSGTGAAGATLYMTLDDPALFGASVQSVTLHVYARYVSGFSPTAPPVTGNIDIGYLTGTATQWTGSQTLPGTGEYIHVMSTNYTTDSDGGSLEEADINALQLAVRRLTGGSSPMRVTEVYAEVRYVP